MTRGRPAAEWQRIETAPEDEVFLALRFHKHKAVYRLVMKDDEFDRIICFPDGGLFEPNYWMPLPPPPTER